MTEKRFTIILDYNDEIGVKENRSGDVVVLNHRDLNSEQFVAQLVMFLNEQDDAIVKLINDEKYWEQKAIKRIDELEKENERLKLELQRIYDVATLKKARDIVDTIYDDLLYETSEKSDYARNKVLECLEKLDEFGDGLE